MQLQMIDRKSANLCCFIRLPFLHQIITYNMLSEKILVAVWYHAKGMVHYFFLKPEDTITAVSYCLKIVVMHEKLVKNNQHCSRTHDHIQPQSLQYEILLRSPYSPDISPTDYYPLNHNNWNDIMKDFELFINSKNEDFFQKYRKLWMRKVISIEYNIIYV